MKAKWTLPLLLLSTLALGCEVGDPSDLQDSSDEEILNSEFPEEDASELATQDFRGCSVASSWVPYTKTTSRHRIEGSKATFSGRFYDCSDLCDVAAEWATLVTGKAYRATYYFECRVYQSFPR